MRIALCVLLAILLSAGTVTAHGGGHLGPLPIGGAKRRPPSNPAAPPGATTVPGAAGVGAVTGPRRRGDSGRNKETTAAGLQAVVAFDGWEFWWEHNRDRFLNLKQRLIKTTSVSGSPGHLTGCGRRVSTHSSRRPNRAMIESDVMPALFRLLQTEEHTVILDSAILALGRITVDARSDEVVLEAIRLLPHAELYVQSSATLTLGVLGSPEAPQLLQHLLRNDSAGQQAVGGRNVHWVTRAFAALSLGLLGDESSVELLKSVVQHLPDSDRDIKVCAVVGLGLLGPGHPGAPGARDFLVERLGDRALDDTVKSYIPTSLGKLGDHAAVEPLLATFSDRDTTSVVRMSAAIGLGLLATMEDEQVVERLLDYVREGKDVQTRHFAMIALAEIGARDTAPGSSEAQLALHGDVVAQLGKEIRKQGKSQQHRSWGALAGAVYSRAQAEAQPFFVDRIRAAYRGEKDPSYKSAFAIALGLLNDQASGREIFEDFRENNDHDFRGYASIALGFMNHADAAQAMRDLVRDKTTIPRLRLQVVRGLSLMGDAPTVDALIQTLHDAQTLGVSSAAAQALGLIGDRDSIGPLKDIALDGSLQDIIRGLACVALGIVGEKTDLPWNASVRAHYNYRASVPSIQQIVDIL